MRFPYQFFDLPYADPASGLTKVARPIIPVTLIHAGKETKPYGYDALVDSGSDWCLFHAEVANVLRMPYRQGRPHSFTGADGGEAEAYFHPVRLRVGGITADIVAGFSEQLPFPYGLLGQRGFFDRFVVTMSLGGSTPYVLVDPFQ